MQKRQDVASIIGPPGLIPVVGVQVSVYDHGTTNLSTIYSDNSSTATGNPVTTDNSGRYSYYAADGRYDEVISGAGIQSTTLTDIVLVDAAADFLNAVVSSITVGSGNDVGILMPSRASNKSFDITVGGGTFNGQFDPTLQIGYNVHRENAAEPSCYYSLEGHYFDGVTHWMEQNFDFFTSSGVNTRLFSMQQDRLTGSGTWQWAGSTAAFATALNNYFLLLNMPASTATLSGNLNIGNFFIGPATKVAQLRFAGGSKELMQLGAAGLSSGISQIQIGIDVTGAVAFPMLAMTATTATFVNGTVDMGVSTLAFYGGTRVTKPGNTGTSFASLSMSSGALASTLAIALNALGLINCTSVAA